METYNVSTSGSSRRGLLKKGTMAANMLRSTR